MFSSTIKITSLDDYIAPSQNCIKPLMAAQNKAEKINIKSDELSELYNILPEKPDLIKINQRKKATVTLNDCLACSGCITTAESILIQQQSVEEFFLKIKDFEITIVSISPQSRASLSSYFGLNDFQIHIFLIQLFQQIGVKYVFDMKIAIDLAINLACEEIQKHLSREEGNQGLPIICSECPGWVCYAEKVVGNSIIPFMSKIKSPQQIMGSIVKELIKKQDITNSYQKEIYHVSVMPCYDKKLEASRPENNLGSAKETDTVISTHEIIDLIKILDNKENGKKSNVLIEEIKNEMLDLQQIFKENNFEKFLFNILETNMKKKNAFKEMFEMLEYSKLKINSFGEGTSNSYLYYVLRYCKERLFCDKNVKLETKNGKNSDFTEYIMEIEGQDFKKTLRFAKIYGLRNIQNFIRNFKKNPNYYAYVEMMACPSGCLNGGGQIKNNDKEIKAKDFLYKISSKLDDESCKVYEDSLNNHLVNLIKDDLLPKINFHTKFHAIEKSENFNW